MIPKSTASLKVGDYCLVPREDGSFVPFVYVGKRGTDRSYFFGALGNSVLTASEEALPARLELLEHALLHIKCYKENNTPIIGNVAARIDSKVLARIAIDINTFNVGQKTSVWGHRTLVTYANRV